jgi:hypothetical protein
VKGVYVVKKENSFLTPTEMGKLWASYMGNSMGKCVLSYYLKHVEDKETKKILEYALNLSQSFVQDIEKFFVQADFPIPIGFTEDEVNLDAPRLFYDQFYLHYLDYLGKAGMSIYSVAIPLVTRKDVREFFIKCLNGTVKLMADINDLLRAKGVLMHSPPMPSPQKINFVNKQSFLNGFFGDVRPLYGLEIAHLYGNINNDITSKALIIGFSQGARLEKVRKYLDRGMNINQKHIEKLSGMLTQNNLPSPPLLDHLVTPSTTPPFSDKLMVFHKIDMFSMKIREYANGVSVSARRDIAALYARCEMDVGLYVEDGANIMIDEGWMEQPPEVLDRESLISKD